MRRTNPFALSAAAVNLYRRTPWQAWWEEFVTALNEWGHIRYLNITQFIKAKAQSPEDQALLVAMIGTAVDEALERKARKRGLGAIGNWEARRYKTWNSSILMRELFREMKEGEVAHMVTKLRVAVLSAIDRAGRLAKRIDSQYLGQPFLPQLAPTAPRNRVRVRQYLRDCAMAFRLLREGIDAWSTLAVLEAAAAGNIMPACGLRNLTEDWLEFARECACQHRQRWNLK